MVILEYGEDGSEESAEDDSQSSSGTDGSEESDEDEDGDDSQSSGGADGSEESDEDEDIQTKTSLRPRVRGLGPWPTGSVILYIIILHDPPFSGEETRMWRLIDPAARCRRNGGGGGHFVSPTLAQRSNTEEA